MGFDTLRFIGEVDEEFHCYICSLVLENPVQTSCEHHFCRHCISEWLTVNQLCPVDREPLSQPHLKPLNRSFRNLWNKLKMKCEFRKALLSMNQCQCLRIFVFIESEGCEEVVKLEHLQAHLTTCEYISITCDKGCNLQMIRREYRANDCFTHFKEHVRKYEHQLSPEIRLVLSNQIAYNECLIKNQQEENTKLVEENKKLKTENKKVEGLQKQLQTLQNQLENCNFTSKSQYAPSITWYWIENMKIDSDLPNILEHEDRDVKSSIAQLNSSLIPKNNSFKVEILAGSEAGSNIRIGLACRGKSFGYYPYIACNNNYIPSSIPHIVDDDIIECGIKFPANFVQSAETQVSVYFIVNGQYEGQVRMPKYGFFPTILFELGEGNVSKPKIKYLSN